jgi:hypothetical protein
VIESCTLARKAIENAVKGAPDMLSDAKIKNRANWLVNEAALTLNAIRSLSNNPAQDPLTDPQVLAKAVEIGIMDAPQLKNNPFARGQIITRIISGACKSVNEAGKPQAEKYRIEALQVKKEKE